MQYLSLIYRRIKDVKEKLNTVFFCRSNRGNVDAFHLFQILGNIDGHPASRAFSYGTYALYREKALHESCQVLVEHAQRVAK